MMKKIMILAAVALTGVSMMAEDKALPAPDKSAGLPVMEAFAQRKSVRDFSDKELSEQDLANLLWVAMGRNLLNLPENHIAIMNNPVGFDGK